MRHWPKVFGVGRKRSERGERVVYGKAYRLLAERFRMRFPICQRCHKRPTREVHHRIPVRIAPTLRLCEWNLEALCRECHEAAEREFPR